MKKQFQNVYKDYNRAEALFTENPTHFINHNINSVNDLYFRAITGILETHPTFMNFIK